MKKSIAILVPAAVMLLFSCVKEMPVDDIGMTPQEEHDPWTPYPLVEVAVLPGNHTISAGFGPETKSYLDVDGTYASVVWNAADAFEMYGYTDGGSFQTATYTNTSGAVGKATFSGVGTITYTANKLHSVYPAAATGTLAKISSNYYIPVTIPKIQVATEGNVAPGALIAYAQSDTQDEDLHFRSAVSIIKFRLSGAAVSSVTEAAFKGSSSLTGTFYLGTTNSTPEYEAGYGADLSLAATLQGSFATGQDYYLAVAPSIHDGFMMTFTNSAGKVIKRISNKSVTLNRGQITDLGTIAIGNSFPDSDPSAIKYMTATAGAPKPVTIVVLPEGFQQTELDTYQTQAQAGIDALFDVEPYKKYKTYFNVWILKVPSKESGANITDGNGNITTARDCYFQTRWGPGYRDMEANADRVFSFVENNCPDVLDGTVTMDKISILLLVNDTRYGGRCISYSDGSNYCMVPTVSGGLSWSYMNAEAASVTATPSNKVPVTNEYITAQKLKNTGDWKNILVHEFGGHAFGRLGDEYWDVNAWYTSATAIPEHTWPVPMSLNISNTSTSAYTPWSELFVSANVDAMGEKSALYGTRIGVFQGGDGSVFYRWRSERISCMIDNRYYFSTWQRRLIVNRIRALSGSSALSFSNFLANDVMHDPVRDGSLVLLPEGLANSVPPKPVPMLPPPLLIEVD